MNRFVATSISVFVSFFYIFYILTFFLVQYIETSPTTIATQAVAAIYDNANPTSQENLESLFTRACTQLDELYIQYQQYIPSQMTKKEALYYYIEQGNDATQDEQKQLVDFCITFEEGTITTRDAFLGLADDQFISKLSNPDAVENEMITSIMNNVKKIEEQRNNPIYSLPYIIIFTVVYILFILKINTGLNRLKRINKTIFSIAITLLLPFIGLFIWQSLVPSDTGFFLDSLANFESSKGYIPDFEQALKTLGPIVIKILIPQSLLYIGMTLAIIWIILLIVYFELLYKKNHIYLKEEIQTLERQQENKEKNKKLKEIQKQKNNKPEQPQPKQQ